MAERASTSRVVIVILLTLAFAGCGEDEGEGNDVNGSQRSINLELGSYRGVGIGDSESEMRRVFGERPPASMDETASPLGEEGTPGPVGFNPWPDGNPRWFRYDDVAFFISDGEITAVMVTDPAATVSDGLTMGSPLSAVEEATGVKDVRCGTANEDTEYEPYAACVGKTRSGHNVWFGGDPLANVTIATVPLEGV